MKTGSTIRTVDQIISDLAVFTDEQRSLAWCPMPPFETAGASDCRRGGSCGLDLNCESLRARVVQARFRWQREQKRSQRLPVHSAVAPEREEEAA
jgi:hypothetical protein